MQAGPQADNNGNLYVAVQNPTTATIVRVQVSVVQYDAITGRAIAQSAPMIIITPDKRGQALVKGVQLKTQQELQLYKVIVEGDEIEGAELVKSQALNACIPFVASIFPVAAFATRNMFK